MLNIQGNVWVGRNDLCSQYAKLDLGELLEEAVENGPIRENCKVQEGESVLANEIGRMAKTVRKQEAVSCKPRKEYQERRESVLQEKGEENSALCLLEHL